jgi:hypothetical protein
LGSPASRPSSEPCVGLTWSTPEYIPLGNDLEGAEVPT